MQRVAVRVCLLTTLVTATASAQGAPIKASKPAATKATPDTSKQSVGTLLVGMLQQLVGRPFRAPPPCVGGSTVTHGRRGDSIPVPDLRTLTVPRAQALLTGRNLRIDLRTAAVAGSPGVVIAQSPPYAEYVASGDAIIVCAVAPNNVDTTVGATGSTGSKTRLVRMPPLVGKSYTIATATLRKVLQIAQLTTPVSVTGLPNQKIDPSQYVVASQQPDPGTVLTATDSIVLTFRDTMPNIKQAPVVQMPRLVNSSYATATDTLERLFRVGRLKLRINQQGVNGEAVDTTRSLVADQQPSAGTTLTPTSAIMLALRDTTTIKRPTVVVHMPPVTKIAYSSADRILTDLFQGNKLAIPVTIRSTAGKPRRLASSIVIRQLPSVGSPLTSESKVTLFIRDTTTPTPPAQPVMMIALEGTAYTVAMGRLTKLYASGGLPITTDVRWPSNAKRVIARSVVVSQSPQPGTILTATSVVRLYVRVTPPPPSPWKKIAAALAVLAAGAAIWHFRHIRNGHGPIEALHVVPHIDPGHPRLIFAVRHAESQEEALARLGLTVRAVADPGVPLLHFPRPRSRSETSNV